MRIDLQLCRHSEMKYFCKWFSDGNCKLSIEICKAPCEKYIDKVVEQLKKQAHIDYPLQQMQTNIPRIMLCSAINIVKAGGNNAKL